MDTSKKVISRNLYFINLLFVLFFIIYKAEAEKKFNFVDIPAHFDSETIQDTANKLREYLFQNYSVLIRPKLNQSEPVIVKFDIALKQVIDVNVKTQKMTLFLWQRQTWYDEFLSWNPNEFGNLTQIFVSPMDIWIPDIIFQNSLDEMEEIKDRSIIKVMLLSSGQVIFFRPTLKSTTCQMSVRYFPYDNQVCAFQVGSWMLPTSQLDIHLLHFETTLSGFVEHHEWDLADRYAQRLTSTVSINLTDVLDQNMTFPYLEFSFLFERKPEFFEKNLIVPTALISVLSEMTFLLPSQSGEKVGFSVTVFLSLCVNLLVIASHVPASSESFPIIGQYYLTCIFLIAISIAQTTLILSVHFTGEQFFVRPVPPLIHKVFFKYIGPLVGHRYPKSHQKIVKHIVNETAFTATLNQRNGNNYHQMTTKKSSNKSNSGSNKKLINNNNSQPLITKNGSLKDRIAQGRLKFTKSFTPISAENQNDTCLEMNIYEPVDTETAECSENVPENSRTNECDDEAELATAEIRLRDLNDKVQDILKYLSEFQKVNENKVNRFRLMEDWKLLSKILDRMSAVIYGTVTTMFTFYFMTTSRSRPMYELVKEVANSTDL